MDFNLVGTLVGFLVCAAVVLTTVTRHRRFALADIGTFVAAFLSGTNLPAAIFLCLYAFFPDEPGVSTKLRGLERFVSFAGLSLLLVSLVSVWGLLRQAYEVAEGSEGQAAPDRPTSGLTMQ